MFEVTKQPAKLVNYTPHTEKHGTEDKSAGSLRVEVVCTNAALDEFYPGLKSMLFRKRGADEPAPKQDTLFDPDELSARRMPQLQPIKWDEEFPGYTTSVSAGLDASEVIVLPACKLSKFTFEAMDGGNCKITFSINTHPDRNGHGFLCWNLQKPLTLTLQAPDAAEVADTRTEEMFPEAEAEAKVEPVLVTGVALETSSKTHLTTATITLSDGREFKPNYAYDPSAEDILERLSIEFSVSADMTPAVRAQLEKAA